MSKTKKQIREDFRTSVFSRDNHRCRICGKQATTTEQLDAHHITDRNEMPHGGYVKENGITLCPIHHELAEMWHRTNKITFVQGFKPEDLYKLINSSYEAAVTASEKEMISRGYAKTLHFRG